MRSLVPLAQASTDPDGLRSKDRIEGIGEFGVPVADQEADLPGPGDLAG
jgi:hypothetical protein